MKLSRLRPRGLFVRIFLHGALLIVAFSLAMGLVFFLLGGAPELERLMGRVTEVLADERSSEDPTHARLQAKLWDIHRISGTDMAIYTLEGERLAAVGSHLPNKLTDRSLRSIEKHGHVHNHGNLATMLPERANLTRAYLIVNWHEGRDHTRFLIALISVLLVLGLISWPLARAIARPIERLTATAKQLATGDLKARSGLDRGDEIGVLAQSIDHMAERIDHNVRAEKELLANVSHELRTPLARIKAALELAELPGTSEAELRDKLTGIAQDASELEQLVSDVLAVSRLELGSSDGGLVIRSELCQIGDLVNDSKRRWKRLHPDRELQVFMPDELPPIEVDATLIRRALDNLLDNAAKYSQEDQPVELDVICPDSNKLCLEVKDRGIGMKEADRERIFEPFFRADSSRSRNGGGVGLGLTLTRRIIEAHGGTVEAYPRPSGGTVFRLVLT
ncbi:MAG: HAMP domain-containing histidine kinase [Proteobacteria bacterium]|nr:HAMP domain-containing histidine kinase [Pseudomonadota bacterium]